MKKWFKSLNWSLFIIIMLLSYIGALGNKNCKSILECLILGTIAGLLFAIPFSILTKDENK